MDLRAIPCDDCGGDGCFEEMIWVGHETRPHYWRCTSCNGTGDEWVEVVPAEMDDLPPPVEDVVGPAAQ